MSVYLTNLQIIYGILGVPLEDLEFLTRQNAYVTAPGGPVPAC